MPQVKVLRPGESVAIDYGKEKGVPINTKTGKQITDPEELREFEEEMKPIREKARKMLMEWETKRN